MGKRLQIYETDRIAVTFDPNVCQHSGVCVRTLPSVFDVSRRRWIAPEAAEPEAVAAAIDQCPSGALQYDWKASGGEAPDHEGGATNLRLRFRSLYAAFNGRDIDFALAQFDPAVDWPNGMEGGRVHGTEDVRTYWTRQWALIDPIVIPTRIAIDEGGRVHVTVHQVVRDLGGTLLKDQHVEHVYELQGTAIVRMDIVDTPKPATSA